MDNFDNLKNYAKLFGFLNSKESPIIELSKRLNELNIPHKLNEGQIVFYEPRVAHLLFNRIKYEGKWTESDIICKPGSYGYEDGLFEIKGIDLMTPEECAEDDVVGYLTMEDVITRIVKAYKLYKNKG
jgi:hypothetical protein